MGDRPCDRCGESYNKTAKYNKICNVCVGKAGVMRDVRMKRTLSLNRIFKNIVTEEIPLLNDRTN